MKKVSFLILIMGVLFSGCASIFSKSNYPININSFPPEASVSITNSKGIEIYRSNTPANTYLKAGDGFFKKAFYQIKISKAGYNEKIIPVQFKVDGWYWGNILIGGLIGMLVIDPATGAMFKLEDGYVNETLIQNSTEMGETSLKIVGLDEVPPSWRNHLVTLEGAIE